MSTRITPPPTKFSTEKAFMQAVRQWADSLGWYPWHNLNAHGSGKGHPDLLLINPLQKRHIYAELKNTKGKLSESQVAFLDRLTQGGAECYVWYPEDENEVLKVLSGGIGYTTMWGARG